MMLNVPEIVVIALILAIVFGLGKLGSIGKGIARLRLHFHKGLGEDCIDITSQQSGSVAVGIGGPKPGARPQPVEDAHIEDPLVSTQNKKESS
jgi:Sec-independent protein translocase protein TatA